MFYSCENADIINKIVKIAPLALVAFILLLLFLDYYKYKKDSMNKNEFYNKALIKLVLAIVILSLSAIGSKKIIKPFIEKCQEKEENKVDADKIKQELNDLKKSLSKGEYERIKKEVNDINDQEIKDELLYELEFIENYVNMNDRVENLKNNYNLAEYYDTFIEIEKISDTDIKNALQTNILSLGKGKPLSVKKAFTSNTKENITYNLGIPAHPVENMPLVIVMQAYDCHADFAVNSSNYTDEEFFFLAPKISAYDDGKLKNFKIIIDEVVEKYKINKKRIIISGHSNGCLETFKLVSFFPDLFAAAVPISYHPNGFNASSFRTTAFWGICGTGETCTSTMENFANKINSSGGNAKATSVPGGHGDAGCSFLNREVLDWAFSQEKK